MLKQAYIMRVNVWEAIHSSYAMLTFHYTLGFLYAGTVGKVAIILGPSSLVRGVPFMLMQVVQVCACFFFF